MKGLKQKGRISLENPYFIQYTVPYKTQTRPNVDFCPENMVVLYN